MASNVIPFPRRNSNDDGRDPPPSAPAAYSPRTYAERTAMAALGAIKRLEEKFENRLLDIGPKAILLHYKPEECELRDRCVSCSLECAIIPARIEWWEGELRRAGGVPLPALLQDAA